MIKLQIIPRVLHFKQPAGTSRGIYTTRNVWYLLAKDTETGRYGVGECAPLPKLSCDDVPNYDEKLQEACEAVERSGHLNHEWLKDFPSIRFGLETAMRQLERGGVQLTDSPFGRGQAGIPINGLIWMGEADVMLNRIEEKLKQGFGCIKMKIGAIDFDKELELMYHIRKRYSAADIELRVDANGAFDPSEALDKLKELFKYHLHSIEQPIKARQWEAMSDLCYESPLPIALDEELIGLNDRARKEEMLDCIQPTYIVLKPSLHGGLQGSEEWIELAEERGINWWATSALESNVGLNALAHWCATFDNPLPQGLGTGQLFTDNIDFPLHIEKDTLWFDPNQPEPDLEHFLMR